MSKEVVSQIKTIRDYLGRDDVVQQFSSALPHHITPDRFLRVAFTTISKNEDLLSCSMPSLIRAMIQSAQLGLELDGILGHAYLVPYKNNKKGTVEANFQVGYKGLIALARRSGEVQSLTAQVVYEKDKFEFAFGLNERLEHVPATGDRGEMLWAYAIARFKDGGHAFDVMSREDIILAKTSSKASNTGPWKTHEAEMWRKTVAKRLAKYLPLSVEFQRAAALDEHYDMGLNDVMSPAQKKTADKTEELKKRIGAGTVDDVNADDKDESLLPEQKWTVDPGEANNA